MKNIPKYVQVLRIAEPPEELAEELKNSYEDGGSNIDENMFKHNPNAKKLVLYIAAKGAKVVGNKVKMSKSENMGNWTYCGKLWYARKDNDEYEYAQYLAYNTKDRKTEGIWDARNH